MRKMISFAVFALLATSLSAQTVANMKDLNAEKKWAAINLKIDRIINNHEKFGISDSFVTCAGN